MERAVPYKVGEVLSSIGVQAAGWQGKAKSHAGAGRERGVLDTGIGGSPWSSNLRHGALEDCGYLVSEGESPVMLTYGRE